MSDEQKDPFWQRAISWLKEIIPTSVALLMALYHYMRQQVLREEVKHDKTKLEKSYLENKNQIDQEVANKSDRDVIDDAITEGGAIRRERGESS